MQCETCVMVVNNQNEKSSNKIFANLNLGPTKIKHKSIKAVVQNVIKIYIYTFLQVHGKYGKALLTSLSTWREKLLHL